MRRLALVLAAMILGAVACVSGGDEGDGGGGAGDGGDGDSGLCAGACAQLVECRGPDEVDASCASDCEEVLQRPADGPIVRGCLTCMAGRSCAELYPADSSPGACEEACATDGGDFCEADEDCDGAAGEVCDLLESVCQIACASDTDCPGQLCCSDGDVPACADECWGGPGGNGGGGSGGGGGAGGGGGGGSCPAGEALNPFDELCHRTCTDIADCYPSDAYCARDSFCYSVEYFADCGRVANLPDAVAGAPLIFGPAQDTIGVGGDLCVKSPSCANGGNVCQFSFGYYDPDGDVPTSKAALFSRIKVIGANGGLDFPYDVLAAQDDTLTVLGCFDEARLSIELAVVLLDDADHRSNGLCSYGSAP